MILKALDVNSQTIDQYLELVSDIQCRKKRLEPPKSTKNNEATNTQKGTPGSSLMTNTECRDNESECEGLNLSIKILDRANSQAIDQNYEFISDLQSMQKRLENPRHTKNSIRGPMLAILARNETPINDETEGDHIYVLINVMINSILKVSIIPKLLTRMFQRPLKTVKSYPR
jgi:hypothetical protein